LVLVTLPGIAWWLAVRIRDWQDFQVLVGEHGEDALAYQTFAESPIEDHHTRFECGRAFYRITEIPLTKAELVAERQARERAARRASYHRAMRRKYAWASWLPWLPVAPDPPVPE
jgi:hypothetical protein